MEFKKHHRSIEAIGCFARRQLNLHFQFKKIYMLNKVTYAIENEFETISDAVRFLQEHSSNATKYSTGNICRCLKSNGATAYGYCWCYVKDYSNDWSAPTMAFKREQPVYCYTNDTIYNTVNEAADKLSLNKGKIARCCNGKEAHTGGYQFCWLADKESRIFMTKDNLKLVYKQDYPQEVIDFLNTNIPTRGFSYCAKKLGRTETSLRGFVYSHLTVRPNISRGKSIYCEELRLTFKSAKQAAEYLANLTGLKEYSLQCSISHQLANKIGVVAKKYHFKWVECSEE